MEHVKEIVAMQHCPTLGGVREKINIVNLIEDSLRINEGAFSRHGQGATLTLELPCTPSEGAHE